MKYLGKVFLHSLVVCLTELHVVIKTKKRRFPVACRTAENVSLVLCALWADAAKKDSVEAVDLYEKLLQQLSDVDQISQEFSNNSSVSRACFSSFNKYSVKHFCILWDVR